MIRATLLLAALLVAAPLLAFDIPDPDLCSATIPAMAVGAVVFVVPDGSGGTFTEAFAPGGVPVDATITLTVVDPNGDLVPNYPAVDMWLETEEGGLAYCSNGTVADQATDANGQTFWVEPLEAGGCTDGEGVVVVIAGMPLTGPPLDLICRSPDFNGDLEVDLSDIVALTQLLGSGSGGCADFNNDGAVNLSDIARFTPAIGSGCD
jgi:hypothetical protein